MKKVIEKHWALIGFIAAFLLDSQFGIIDAIAPNEMVARLIQGVGAIILAHFWQSENVMKIGGGGIKNPKKP